MREEFEKWISSPPYEKSIERYPDDAQRFAWPGNYRDIAVELAWQAWKSNGADIPDPDAVGRLRAWIRDYGHEKQPVFIADLKTVLGLSSTEE